MGFFTREKNAEKLRVIVIGAGQVGFHVAQRLAGEDKQVVVIDQNPEALHRISDTLDVQTILGSGSSPVVLHDAGVDEANIVLAVTDSDETNIVACLFANIINPAATKVARIRNEEYTLYRDALGQDILNIAMTINPELEVVKNIDRMLNFPKAIEYNEFADGRIHLMGLRISSGPLIGLKLAKFRTVMPNSSVIIAAIVRNEELIIPSGVDTIQENDTVYFVCEPSALPAVRIAARVEREPVRSVLIVGGGNIGLRLALFFEHKGYQVKLIEKDEARCHELSEKLNSTLVLHGDATDQELLREENIGAMDAIVSLTSNEEINVLCSLLGKKMGVRRTVARINKSAYQPLAEAIGIEHSVSPRLSAVNSILHFVRRGKVLSSVAIRGEQAEVMEAVALKDSAIVGKALRELSFPKGAIILAIMRDKDVVIPSGETIITPTDRVLIMATRQAISSVETSLAVKLRAF